MLKVNRKREVNYMNNDYNIGSGADRVKEVEFSAIREIMDKAAELRAEGKDVIALSAGEPNFNTPQTIKEAAKKAIDDNFTHYGSNRGYPKLRKIMAKKLEEETGVSYNPDTEIVFMTGGAEAINNAILAMINPGDEVLLISPAFVSYKNMIRLCGAQCKEIPLSKENEFQPVVADIENQITEKTKMLIINNPNNPTGAVYDKEVLEGISLLARKYNFLVLSDEMYSSLVYEGTFYSMAAFPGMKERTIVINGFSKTYAMTGWRIGYIQAPEKIMTNIMKVHQYSSTCSPTFIQVAMAEAIEQKETTDAVNEMVAKFANRRELLIEKVKELPKITYVKPSGAFYMIIDVSATGLTGKDFSNRLLTEKYVATVPVVSMGKDNLCSDLVRISFAASDEAIVKGIDRMREFIESIG